MTRPPIPDQLAAECLRLKAKGWSYRKIARNMAEIFCVEGREVKRRPFTVDAVKGIVRRARAALEKQQSEERE